MKTIRIIFGGLYAAVAALALLAGPDAVRPRAAYILGPAFLIATALLIIRPYKGDK